MTALRGREGAGGRWEGWRLWESGRTAQLPGPTPAGHHECLRANVFTIRSLARRGAGSIQGGRGAGTGDSPAPDSEASPGTPHPAVRGDRELQPNPARRPPDLQSPRALPSAPAEAPSLAGTRTLGDPNLEPETQSPKTTTCVRGWGGAPRPARSAPATPVDHKEDAIAGSAGAPKAPGTAGRICSEHAGQTRRQLQPLRLANLQHLPPLVRIGFAPRAGGGPGAGWGRGFPQPAPPRPWRSLCPESHSKASGHGWLRSATP